jgi:hypothetical protein
VLAAPIRSSTQAWGVVADLITSTLSRSPHLSEEDIRSELLLLSGIGPAMIAGGHLSKSPLWLVSTDLRVSINVQIGDAALTTNENLNAVPGGGTADSAWRLHLPCPISLEKALNKLIETSSHLTVDPVPSMSKAASQTNNGPIDISALRNLDVNR